MVIFPHSTWRKSAKRANISYEHLHSAISLVCLESGWLWCGRHPKIDFTVMMWNLSTYQSIREWSIQEPGGKERIDNEPFLSQRNSKVMVAVYQVGWWFLVIATQLQPFQFLVSCFPKTLKIACRLQLCERTCSCFLLDDPSCADVCNWCDEQRVFALMVGRRQWLITWTTMEFQVKYLKLNHE